MPRDSFDDLARLCLQFETIEKHSPKCRHGDHGRPTSSLRRGILKKSASLGLATEYPTKTKQCVEHRIESDDVDNTDDGNSKNVTFADDCDCDLVEIRKFVPSSEDMDLWSSCEYFQRTTIDIRTSRFRDFNSSSLPGTPQLALCFRDPFLDPEFDEKFKKRSVALERCGAKDRVISGIILVRNIEYKKHVFVRSTVDSWKTSSDIDAVHIPNSSHGGTDRFTFSLVLPKCSYDLEFAVCYRLSTGDHWDNNDDRNFRVQDVLYGAKK